MTGLAWARGVAGAAAARRLAVSGDGRFVAGIWIDASSSAPRPHVHDRVAGQEVALPGVPLQDVWNWQLRP